MDDLTTAQVDVADAYQRGYRRACEDMTAFDENVALAETRAALRELVEAVDALDLSDDYTLEQARPIEDVSCTRAAMTWLELKKAHRNASLALPSLQADRERSTEED